MVVGEVLTNEVSNTVVQVVDTHINVIFSALGGGPEQHVEVHEVIDDDLEVVAGLAAPAADATNNLAVTGSEGTTGLEDDVLVLVIACVLIGSNEGIADHETKVVSAGVVGLSSHLGCVLDGEVLEGLILSVVIHKPQLSSEEATDPISRASKFVVDIILRNIAVLGVGGELVVNGDVVGDLEHLRGASLENELRIKS